MKNNKNNNHKSNWNFKQHHNELHYTVNLEEQIYDCEEYWMP